MTVFYNQGIPCGSNGGLSLIPMPASVPAGTCYRNGWALDPTGAAYFIDVGLGSVPSTATFHKGVAFSSMGAVYTTTDTTGTYFVTTGGIKVRSDGALLLGTNVTTASSFNGGLGFTSTGALFPGGDGVSFSSSLQSSLVPGISVGDGTPTFTRATTAYQTDFEGKLNLLPAGAARMQGARVVHNLVSPSSVDVSAWTPSGTATVTGTNIVNFPAASDAIALNLGASVQTANRTFTVSWTLSGTGTTDMLVFNSAFDDSNDVKVTLSATPARFVNTWTFNGTAANLVVYLRRTVGSTATQVTVSDVQIEDVTGQTITIPSEKVSVGVLSAPYHGLGADGIKAFSTLNGNTVASNVVTEATGAAINSSQAACAGGVTAGVVDASGPIGFLPEAVRTQYLGVTDAPATQTTASLGTGTYTLWQTGTGSSTSSAGTATITGGGAATAGSPNTFVVTVAGTVTVTVAGSPTTFQLENGATPSSYIPNAGAAGTSVTRNGDVLQGVSAGNLNATAMTLALDWTPEAAAMGTVFMFGTYVDASNYTAILHDGTNVTARKRIGGTNHDATKALTYAAGTTYRIVGRFDSTNGVDVWVAGVKGTGDATTTASQIGTNFQVGADGNSLQQAFGPIRNFIVKQKGLPDAEAAAL